MSFILLAAWKDVRRYLRDPLALLLWLAIPLLVGGLTILGMGGSEGPTPKVHLLVADEDNSFGSRLLVGAFGQGHAGDIIQTEMVDRQTGRHRLDRGEASALLVIPEGFGKAVVAETPTKLLLITNPSQQVLPAIVEQLLSILSDTAFYAQRIFGPEIRAMGAGPPHGGALFSDEEISAMSVASNKTARQLAKYLVPPVIQLKTTVIRPASDASAEPAPFLAQYLPGILLMALLFAAQGLSDDIWRERELGVLRRVVTTPLGMMRFLAAKLVAVVTILTGIGAIVLATGMSYLGLPLARFPLALAWSVTVGAMLTALMLLLQVFASSHRGASILTFAVVMPLMMIGGSMFPFEFMPHWMAAIGRLTPNGWSTRAS